MIRTLIVDDEPLARRGVRVCLRGVTDVTVIGECSTGQSAVEQILRARPDLVFLDAQMPNMNGFEVLSHIPEESWPLIIFITAYDEYALRAFDVHAVDYVLKPIDDARFAEALDRARQIFQQRAAQVVVERLRSLLAEGQVNTGKDRYRDRFAIKTGGRTAIIAAEDIEWLQASGDYVALHIGKKAYLLRETLDGLERQLDPKRFIRIHRSTMVALDEIKELQSLSSRDSLIRLNDGTELRASRRYRHRLQGVI
jgi:two-component system, LytTR family, response regulator